jgi:hypothetical protein
MFDEGNDDGAEKLAAQLISKDGDDYKIMLQMRTKYRKRLRMIAFGIAGLVMIILSTMVISGVHQVITLTHNLPGLSLPETPDFNPIREIATQIRRPTQLVTVGIDGQPPIEDAFNAQATKSDLTDTPDVVLPDQNSPDVDTGDPSPDVVKNTPEVDYTGDIQICAIGRLVVASATETVLNAKNIAGARKVDAFSKKVSAACKRIPVPESVLLEAERDIVGVDIAKMAASIISQ